MGWYFRKSVKVIPGVRVNFSKRGVSTSIGVRGAGLNFSNRGVYAYSSIPGTGIGFREKIGGGQASNRQQFIPENNYLPEPSNQYIPELTDNIISVDVQQITSQDMQGVKELILSTHAQRQSLAKSIFELKRIIIWTKIKLILCYTVLINLYYKSLFGKVEASLIAQKETFEALKEQLELSVVNLEIDFDDTIRPYYEKLVAAYKNLIASKKVWDITGSYYNDRVTTRSAASTLIKKQDVRIEFKHLPDIKTEFTPFCLHNANGGDLYMFPNFMIAYRGKDSFAVVGYDELELDFSQSRFLETGTIPVDTKIIDRTWNKVNKDGSRDRRFKDNFQIPIVLYANIYLKTRTGLNEAYQFSNFEYAKSFYEAFVEYQRKIMSLKSISE